MRKTAIAFALSFTFALMMVAQPISAGTAIVVADRPGDVCKLYYTATGEPKNTWGDNAPIMQAGYIDMISMWLEKKGATYTFGMELAAALPEVGAALPSGIKALRWNMWIESAGPWDPNNPVPMAYVIMLMYFDSSYSAALLDVGAWAFTPLPFSIDGSELQMKFSADLIGGLSSFWFSYGTVVYFGAGGYWNPDNPDPGACPGQVYWDIPWPPV